MSQPTNEQLNHLREQVISVGVASVTSNFIESAKGAVLRDVDGREYIDFAGGIAVMNIGHSHPKVVAAIQQQAEKLTHTCFMVNPYEPAVKLAQKLCALTPGDFAKRAVFLNSGAEAVENAVKIARYATGRPAVTAMLSGYWPRL
jgi:4-aminobutyrate aminotransferase/(S)-3-amino-2-methylpropionate transaminase